MNIKKFSILILIVLSFIICISAVSASDSDSSISSDVVNKEKIDTEVDMDDIAVVHKKNSFFKVKVEDDDKDKPVKNLKIKLKIFSKSKSKSFNIKTNSKGIAKFNTKNLGMGKHKVIITSLDDQYPISKKANIYVGKKNTVTLKENSQIKLKNKDTIRTYTKIDDEDKELKVAFKGVPKHTVILKAKFYFKNKITGKIIVKTDVFEFDDGKWDFPDKEYSYKYVPTKIKVSYITF